MNFPICLHIYLMTHSLITQLHTAFSTEFLHPSVHGMPTAVSKRSYSIFCFLLVAPRDIIQAAQWGRDYGCPYGLVLVFCSSSPQYKGPGFQWSCLILDAVLTPFTNHGNARTLRMCFGQTASPSVSDFVISIILLIPGVPFKIRARVFSSSYLALKINWYGNILLPIFDFTILFGDILYQNRAPSLL